MTIALPFDTERLHIRMMRSSDAAAVTAYRNDPRVSQMQDWPLPYPIEHALERLTDQDHREAPVDGGNQLAVEFDGAVIGDLYLGLNVGDAPTGTAEIGYTLTHDAQGQGFAREAAEALVARLFESGHIHRVTASLHVANRASQRLLEHIGFEFESITKLSFTDRNTGLPEDDMHYALTRDEWQAWITRPTQPPASVELVEIGPGEGEHWMELHTHRSQQKFVATVAESYADALFPEMYKGAPVVPWIRGILADGERAGFTMMAEVTAAHPDPYLWRLLIDRRHQRRGIGERVIDLLVARCREQGHTRLTTSWVPGVSGSPEPFYRRLGFEPTGEFDDDEVVGALDVAGFTLPPRA